MGKLGSVTAKIFNAASVVFAMVESSIFGASGKEKSLCQVLMGGHRAAAQFLIKFRTDDGQTVVTSQPNDH
eukprot:scaffold89278_cov33-Cyclotella_meneghiniana.AAC.1